MHRASLEPSSTMHENSHFSHRMLEKVIRSGRAIRFSGYGGERLQTRPHGRDFPKDAAKNQEAAQ